jgi:hypothetical protein
MFEAKQAAGERVPFLEDKPSDPTLGAWIFDAFIALATQRLSGHDDHPQPIAISDIAAYAQLMDITDPDEKEDLLNGILKLDDVSLNYMRDQINKDNKKKAREAKAKQSMAGKRGRRR